MDPAGPLFETPIEKTSDQRLCASDAITVEAYHTNKGILGCEKPIAQQDFYINDGGPNQPDCVGRNFTKKKSFSVLINLCILAWCSHEYSHEFYRKTIPNPVYYVAKKCDYNFAFQKKECLSGIVVKVGEHNNGTGIEGVFYIQIGNSI